MKDAYTLALEAKLHKWNVLVAQGCTPSGSEFHDSPENVARYLKERDADKDRIMKSQQHELNRERSRADVLAAEVKAWRACKGGEPTNERFFYSASWTAGDGVYLTAMRAATDSTHAIDPAKFAPPITINVMSGGSVDFSGLPKAFEVTDPAKFEGKPFVLEMDGDAWCAHRNDFINFQESIAGFGATRREAIEDCIRKENAANKGKP